MRTNPHILEINTRAWIRRLEAELGTKLTLSQIPDHYWAEARDMGFDAVWLMGVWKKSPKGEEIARSLKEIIEPARAADPQVTVEDITASPYAVYEYEVDPELGGTEDLKKLHEKFNNMGLLLFLDFVGNHTSIDSPTVTSDPDLYINTGVNTPHVHQDWFFTNANGVHIAHGRDPYFAPWTDSAQLNYFNPKTREFMLKNLLRVADLCDGVRCDMAMLSLNKVHRDTWWEFIGGELPQEEFWTQALKAVREKYPEFVFLAEVYWGLEWDIQQLGFDYTYDKILYDRLRFSTPQSIKAHLGAEHLFQMRSLRFTANHDEEEALKAFGREKSLAASTIIATLPGARMFHLFQLLGRPVRLPIQCTRDFFPIDKEIWRYYANMLRVASEPSFHGGQWSLKGLRPAEADNTSVENILAWQWKQMNTCKVVVINYSAQPAVCVLPMKSSDAADGKITEELSGQTLQIQPESHSQGLRLELKPFESKIFTFAI